MDEPVIFVHTDVFDAMGHETRVIETSRKLTSCISAEECEANVRVLLYPEIPKTLIEELIKIKPR